MSMASPSAKRLLSIDGGGVKGCSSVMILDAILAKVREIENKPYEPMKHHAYDYFDLAGGTSTGGLAALMMFRLKLSTKETADKYDAMAKKIFSPKVMGVDIQQKFGKLGYWLGNGVLKFKTISYPSRFPSEQLEQAIEEVVGDRTTPLLNKPGSPKMLMCSTLADKGETMLFRSYQPPSDAAPVSTAARSADFSDISILEACRATSAAPTYFPPMNISRMASTPTTLARMTTFTFWDGGVLNNNPIDQVWDARFDLATSPNETPAISCVVSIGTSFANTKRSYGGQLQNLIYTVTQLMSFVTNTEAKHKDFARNIDRMNLRLPADQQTKYFRFNVPTGDEEFPMDDWQKMPKLKQKTQEYLDTPEIRQKIDECAPRLARS